MFDLDGTLVDTAADIHAVLADVLGETGHPVPDLPAVRSMIGDGARVLIERAVSQSPPQTWTTCIADSRCATPRCRAGTAGSTPEL